jgi:hypothetical protein
MGIMMLTLATLDDMIDDIFTYSPTEWYVQMSSIMSSSIASVTPCWMIDRSDARRGPKERSSHAGRVQPASIIAPTMVLATVTSTYRAVAVQVGI